MTLPFPLVQAGVAARLTVEFCLLGVGWAWVMRLALVPLPPFKRGVVLLGLSVLAGVLSVLGVVYALASCGRYSPFAEALALAAVGGLGLLIGVGLDRNRGRDMLPAARTAGAGLAAVFVLLWVVLILPRRGEWVAGGWDPGLYMNQGMHVARTGSFSIQSHPYFRLPPDEETRHLFRFDRDNRRQTMPGILVMEESRRQEFQFFRLMPAFVAATARCGGLEAAVRANHIAAVLALALMAALAAYLGTGRYACVAVAVLALQPIVLWHTHVPVSEMLQLVLILGALLCAVAPATAGSAAGVCACFVAAMLNRVSFFAFGFVFLFCLAVFDWDGRFAKARLFRHVGIAVALMLGMALDLWSLPVTVMGVSDAHLGMTLAPLVVLPVVLAIDTLPRWGWIVAAVSRYGDFLRRAGMLAAVLLIPFLWWVPTPLHQWHDKIEPGNLARLLAYLGVGVGLLAWAGLVLAWRRGGSRALAFCMSFLMLCTALLMFRKYIESIYPWATRRFLDLVPPLAALGVALTVDVVVGALPWRRRFVAGAIACGLVAAACAPAASRIRAAWANTEYDGAGVALARVAAAVPDDALVVCDHFLWGTPLQSVFGKQVLVAVCPKKTTPGAFYARALASAAPATAGRLLLLTSTGEDVTSRDFAPELLLDIPWETREAVHHRTPHPFNVKPRSFRFRLYEIRPADLVRAPAP